MGIEDLIFWLFLGFALFSRLFAWIIERLRGQGTTPQPARQPESVDDYFDEDWDEPQRESAAASPTPTAPTQVPPQVMPKTQGAALTRVAAPVSGKLGTIEPAASTKATTPFTAADQGLRLRQQLGLDQRSALQRSVLLMAVLGPCRANERESGQRNDVSF